jgi:ferrochelatase
MERAAEKTDEKMHEKTDEKMHDRAGQGVVLVSHGTVRQASADATMASRARDMREFLGRIRHGRPASDELVDEMLRRYDAIGGSPLAVHTAAQASALQERMDVPVLVATRFGEPSLCDAITQAAALGIRRLCVVPLAPFSVKIYVDAFVDAAEGLRREGATVPECLGVEAWGTEHAFVEAHAEAIESALAEDRTGDRTALVLTAHSLPTRVIAAGDGYQREVEACASAITNRVGRRGVIAYQSQGADGGAWLGPDLQTALRTIRSEGASDVVLAPIGFLAEHVETLYDLDIEAVTWCAEIGLTMHRVPALNTAPRLIEALEAVALRALDRVPARSPRRGAD